MTEIYIAKTDILCDKTQFLKRYNALPSERKEKADRLPHEADKHLSVASWHLLLFALNKKGIREDEIILSKNEHGKPFLKNYPEVHFNLSHSGNTVMCAVSQGEVGCDTEKIRPVKLKIADRFFSENEIRQLKNADAKEQELLFFRLWTLKESFMKATGHGFSLPLKDFCININEQKIEIEQNVQNEKFYFKEFFKNDGYCYAVCAKEKDFSDLIEIEI